MRKLARGEHQASETEENSGKRNDPVTLVDVLVVVGSFVGIMLGANFLFMNVQKSGLAEDMADPASSFVLSEAKPAEELIKTMHEPVRRAVLVPATEQVTYKGLVCAEAVDGTLELYALSNARHNRSLDQISMNSDLEAAAPAFCAAAFSQLN